MEGQQGSNSLPVTVTPSNKKKRNANQRRNRNRNRNKQSADSTSHSPVRSHDGDGGNKSRSPKRNNSSRRGHQSKHHQHDAEHPADMTVICNRCDLWDSAAYFFPDETHHPHRYHNVHAKPYYFAPDIAKGRKASPPELPNPECGTVAIARVPHHFTKCDIPLRAEGQVHCEVLDTSIPNPHDPEVVHDKYWVQRRRLFSKFDEGIKLDGQGFYSVTPEIIADHVAQRVAEMATSDVIPHDVSAGIVILDAFAGCGGNSIAFGKIPSNIISKVVCVDTDRSKLLKAAHNASLYGIPRDKLVFVECNSIFILQHCYKDGQFILDQPTADLPPYMPPPVMPIIHAGYQVGGLDLLPRRIDAVFMDPPWGGVDYEVLGKNGYDLHRNMKIQVGPPVPVAPPEDEYEADGDGCDGFFDTFAAPKPKPKQLSQKARKANFNKQVEGGHFIDGMELLRVAAKAVRARVVVYDLPRNTNKLTLGKCALGAGYRGNIKLDEHYLNGRLKTVTAYLGGEFSDLINNLPARPRSKSVDNM